MQIPNLGNAATSNTDLYKKRLKKKKKKVNRDQIPNLGNAAKSNKDLYVSKEKKNVKQKKEKKLSPKEKAREKAQALARKRIGTGTAKKPQTTIAQLRERNKKRIQKKAKDTNTDFKKMRSGEMSKATFIKRNPNSQTAKKAKKEITNKRSTNTRQENKKFNITKNDTRTTKFIKKGGLAGLLNRRLKILRNMSQDDLRLFKNKKKKK